MAASLNTCTTIEQRGFVWFLGTTDMAAKDIHKEMLPMYGEHLPVTSSSLLKQHLSGECFPDDDAIERAVCAWFRKQPQEFYAAGLQELVKQWDKCLNLLVDYVEN